ncbi:MAG: ribose-phosphate diphosphokinase [Methanomassiliicoccaceae archaeon]|nr:ribose-phosphate diphosphokinase [Methanomassiliicoccaceae archaeon]
MIVIGGSTSRDLAKELAMLLECKCILASSTRFPDGECYTRIEGESLNDDVVIVQNTYPDHSIIEMLLLQDAAKRMGARSITLVIPYFGYARQDRIFKPGEPLSAKVMANHLGLVCDRVITIDIHKESVLKNFKCPASDIKASGAIAEYFMDKGIDLVLAPDAGAAERAKDVGTRMGLPYDHLEKTRLSGTEVRIAPAKRGCVNKNVLIVDDIIATGGTILAATIQLKEAGAKSVSVVCTHGVFTGDAIQRLTGGNIDALLCCNTLESKVSNISVASAVAEELKRAKKKKGILRKN